MINKNLGTARNKRLGQSQLVLWLFLLMIVLFPLTLYSQSGSLKAHFQGLKTKYLRIRNTDPEVLKVKEWSELAVAFEKFADRYPGFSGTPSGLFNASILYQEMYRNHGDRRHLSRCLQLLEKLAEDYPGHSLADDGLIRQGDLYLFELGDEAKALNSYQTVRKDYPDSDMFDVAGVKIAAIEEGTYKKTLWKSTAKEDSQLLGKKDDRPVILLDPGHGGEDFGAVGNGGLLEKDVVLAVALELEKLLEEKIGAVVHLTRRKDVFVPLADRTALANAHQADLFISLHCNATESGKASGLEMYYLDNTGDQASRKLAERENASTRFEGPEADLRYMLSDLIQGAKQGDSVALANLVGRSLSSFLKARWKGINNRGVKKAPFYVLVGAHMPCVIIEMFFINNEADGTKLSLEDFRKDLAFGLYISIKGFLEHEGWKL